MTIEDCLLICGPVAISLPAGCEATLTNNVIYAGDLFAFGDPGGQTLRLTHNTLLAWGNWEGGTSAQQWAGRTKDISVVAEGNILQSVKNGWGMPDEVKDHVHWLGKDNAYAGLWRGHDGQSPGLELWNRQLGQAETGSREVAEVPLAWRTDLPGDAAGAISWWQSRLTRTGPKAASRISAPISH